MNEKLLCTCSNSMIAHQVIGALKDADIPFRLKDETNVSHAGVSGPDPGIAIYVHEEDFEKALAQVGPALNLQDEHIKPFCPKCGSEDVRRLERSRFITPLLLISMALFIAPVAYLHFAKGSDNQLLYYLSIASFVSSIVIFIVCSYKDAGYKCNQCGKRFNRR